MRAKAEFRALREMLGLMQKDVADMLEVNLRSVKRWESPASPENTPPQEAWELLDELMEDQKQVIAFTLAKVDEIAQQQGNYPEQVTLPYWASQEEYDKYHSSDDSGSSREANATTRLVAYALAERGIKVAFIDGKDNQVPKQV